MNLQAERELFEKTMFTNSFMFSTIWHDDEYMDLYTQSMWQSWLASRNREGYALVPVEPNDRMISVGWSSQHPANIYKAMIKEVQREI